MTTKQHIQFHDKSKAITDSQFCLVVSHGDGSQDMFSFTSAHDDKSIEDQILGMDSDSPGDSFDMVRFCVRTAITSLLLKGDPEFVKPDVLAADRYKFDQTGDVKYVEKAKRHGIVGWRIGEEFESMPHFRRPHLGLRWTGEGGKVPKIVPIKGAVVHRQKMTQVPTGYMTDNGVEVECAESV